jgi:hypothetical protein
MTPTEFRRLALSFPETEERSHMNHPDFRLRGKIFATLSYPNESRGMVQLTPIEQEMFMKDEPEAFSPASGAWGRGGSTMVNLKLVKKATIRKALEAAWQLAMAKQSGKKSSKQPSKKKLAAKTR